MESSAVVSFLVDAMGKFYSPGNPMPLASGSLPLGPRVSVDVKIRGNGPFNSYAIVPVNASGQDGVPGPTTRTDDNQPVGVTGQNILTWDTVPGAVGYKILRNAQLIGQVPGSQNWFEDNLQGTGVQYTAAAAPGEASAATASPNCD